LRYENIQELCNQTCGKFCGKREETASQIRHSPKTIKSVRTFLKKNIVLSCVEVTSGSRFGDTNWMFVALSRLDLGISAEGSPQYWAAQAMIGRRPPFKSVASEGCCFLSVTSRFVAANDSLLREDCAGLVACMAAHDTHGINEKVLRHDCGRFIGLWRPLRYGSHAEHYRQSTVETSAITTAA
jgi:hypothetical protein